MTTQELRDLLPSYALGILTPEEEATIERAVARDATLAAELASCRDAVAAMIVPVAPSPEVKTRLMASVGDGRFEKFTSRLSTLFDVSVDRAREIFGLADRGASWQPAMPGVHLVHFDGGPAYAAADCGFVRLAAGAVFPLHTHIGEEVSLILSGRLQVLEVDGATRLLGEGDELVEAHGTAHQLIAIGGECMFAARAMSGIEIDGARVRPSTPDH